MKPAQSALVEHGVMSVWLDAAAQPGLNPVEPPVPPQHSPGLLVKQTSPAPACAAVYVKLSMVAVRPQQGSRSDPK